MPIIEACKKATFACKRSSPLLLKFHLQGLFLRAARTVQHWRDCCRTRARPHRALSESAARTALAVASMPFITVLNQRRYVGKEQGSLVKLQLGVNDWITKKRNKNETDEDMESRVTAELLKEMQSRAAASTAAEMLRGEVPCSARCWNKRVTGR